jgi:hypothetical protein
MTGKRSNPVRWNADGTDPISAAKSAAEAKRRNLPQWQHEMSQNVGTDVVRSLVEDSRAFAQQNNLSRGRQPEPMRAIEPARLQTPYVSVVDRLCEAQAKADFEAEVVRRMEIAAKVKGLKSG